MSLPRLTYANVAIAVALVLAIGGGTVYAAAELGKNDVHSRNIAPGAVKTSDLGKNAVTSSKIKNGTVRAADFAAGVIKDDVPAVTGSATGGPQAVNANNASPLPLSGTTTFTPQSNQVSAIAAEAHFSIATTNSAQTCQPHVGLYVDGQPTRVTLYPMNNNTTSTLVGVTAWDADGPFGLINSGTPMTITAQLEGDPVCTADSKVDRVEVRIVQFH
jgi:hypothetical protein